MKYFDKTIKTNKMQDLKELTILEVFRGFDNERQKNLLSALIKERNEVSATIVFSDINKERFFWFLRDAYEDDISFDFFEETWRRWELLREKSYSYFIFEGVDLYLQARPWKYDDIPFRNDEERDGCFHITFLKCNWETMKISKKPTDWNFSFIQNYKIKDLMELDRRHFEIDMKSYGFL